MKNKFLWLMLVPLVALADSDPDVVAGNAALQNKKPEEALALYEKAEATLSGNADLAFNQGGARYALQKYEEAATDFLSSTSSKDNVKRAASYRHYGDSLFRQEKIDDAIQAYIQALTLNPEDKVAAHNLEVALNKQQPQSQPQSQESQDPQSQPQSQESQSQPSSQQNQEQQNQEQNQQNQDQQDQQNQGQQGEQKKDEQSAQKGQEDQEKKDGQSSQGEQKKDEQQGEQSKQAQQEQSQQEPQDKLLDALRAKEKSFLRAKKKGKGNPPTNVNKDW